MNKRLLLCAALLIVMALPASASAHVFVRDTASGTGAILHVNPDDDPIAGERATLFFDIRDDAINPDLSQAILTITAQDGTAAVVPSELRGSSVSAGYVFPHQGLYSIRLVISQDGVTTHLFLQSQRVSRGILGQVLADNSPAWAEVGTMLALVTAVFVGIIAYNRRRLIRIYSKW